MSRVRKQRLDTLLCERGYFETPDQALRAILARKVRVGDEYPQGGALLVAEDADIAVQQDSRFVSRGGEKLQAALDAFDQDVTGLSCIDIGSSTGGFSDCLLQAGAAQVTCVDVNYGQLAWKIRQDERTRVFERTNIKTISPQKLGAPFDLLVADLSFIGLAQLVEIFACLLHPGGVFIGLIKPQFESHYGETDHGVVRDPEVRMRTISKVHAALEQAGFSVTGVIESPLKGPAGNIEYLIRAIF